MCRHSRSSAGVPQSMLYDNLKIAVAKICGYGRRERTRAFTGLVSHYLFTDHFGRPRKPQKTAIWSPVGHHSCQIPHCLPRNAQIIEFLKVPQSLWSSSRGTR